MNPALVAKKTSACGVVTVVAIIRTASSTIARTATLRITNIIVARAMTIASFVTAKTIGNATAGTVTSSAIA